MSQQYSIWQMMNDKTCSNCHIAKKHKNLCMYQLPIENFELVFKNRSNMVTFYQMNTEVLNTFII